MLIERARSEQPGQRAGFSLGEVLVAVAIIILLTVMVVPSIMGRLNSAQSDAIIGELRTLDDGLQLFRRDVGRYPRRLDYLNVLPTAGGVLDACNVAISGPNQAKFRGPYINRSIVMVDPGTGNTKYVFSTGDTIESTLRRTTIPAAIGTQQVLQILVYGPSPATASAIDLLVDGVVDFAAGTVQFIDTPAATDTVKWTIPIKNDSC